MALVVEVIHFDSATSTGVQTVNLTKFAGVTPKAVVLFCNTATATGVTDNSRFGMGIATSSTSRAAFSTADQDAAATQSCGSASSDAHCVYACDASGALLWVGDLDSFAANQLKIDWSTVQATAAKMTAFVFGGTDISNAVVSKRAMPTGTGSDSQTGIGFQADGAIVFRQPGDDDAEPPPNNTAGDFYSFVAVWGNTNTGCISWSGEDGQMRNTGRYRAWSNNAVTFTDRGDATLDGNATFTSWDSDGYTLNWSTLDDIFTSSTYWGLFLKGATTEVASTTLPTTAQTKDANVGFASEAYMFLCTGSTASSATGESFHVGSVGVSDKSTEGCHSWSADHSDPSDTRKRINQSKVCSILAHNSTTEETIGNHSSAVSPNVTINFTTVSGNADNYLVWAIESAAAPPAGHDHHFLPLLGVG